MASQTKILESIVVSVSAPAISLMLYDNCNSDDQAGFLLGDIFRTENVIHEPNREGVKVQLKKYKFHIRIKAAIACPEINFYKIDYKPEDIPKIDNIVGWFTSRELITTNPINPFRLTFTEKLIHKTLNDLARFTKLPFFTGCVLDTSKNFSRNVHSYDFNFFQLNQDNNFQEVECENPVSELKSFESPLFTPLGKRRDFIKPYQKASAFEKIRNQEFIDESIQKLAVAESNLFILLKHINHISMDIERLQKHKIQQKTKPSQVQESNIKPSWVTQLEQKRLYPNPKIASQ